MADEHASRYGLSGAQVAHSSDLSSYQNAGDENAGFGADLRCGTESRPDGDNDTDDIGTYPPIGPFRGSTGAYG